MKWEGSPFFTQKELECKCGCKGLPKLDFIEKLVTIRSECNFSFIVTSGFRCPEHNLKVSTTGDNGPHTQGRAVDIAVYGSRALTLIKIALKHGFTGIGVKQNGFHSGRFIHLDDLTENRPYIWSY